MSSSQALNRHLLYRSGDKECMTIFQTFSPADMHWDGFHRLLPKEDTKAYLDKIIVSKPIDIPEGEEDKYITKSQDFLLRSQNVNKHARLFVKYFVARVKLLIEHVLKPILGIEEHFVRFEYQGRGMYLLIIACIIIVFPRIIIVIIIIIIIIAIIFSMSVIFTHH